MMNSFCMNHPIISLFMVGIICFSVVETARIIFENNEKVESIEE